MSKNPVEELKKIESAPLRRSSRISTNSPVPKTTTKTSIFANKEDEKQSKLKTRASSVPLDAAAPEKKKITTRRSSASQETQDRPKTPQRARRPSITKTNGDAEEAKPVTRRRRSSSTSSISEVVEEKPSNLAPIKEVVERKGPITRRRTSMNQDKEETPKKITRARRNSAKTDDAPVEEPKQSTSTVSTPEKNIPEEKNINQLEDDSKEESDGKKNKKDLNLSVIKETSHTEDDLMVGDSQKKEEAKSKVEDTSIESLNFSLNSSSGKENLSPIKKTSYVVLLKENLSEGKLNLSKTKDKNVSECEPMDVDDFPSDYDFGNSTPNKSKVKRFSLSLSKSVHEEVVKTPETNIDANLTHTIVKNIEASPKTAKSPISKTNSINLIENQVDVVEIDSEINQNGEEILKKVELDNSKSEILDRSGEPLSKIEASESPGNLPLNRTKTNEKLSSISEEMVNNETNKDRVVEETENVLNRTETIIPDKQVENEKEKIEETEIIEETQKTLEEQIEEEATRLEAFDDVIQTLEVGEENFKSPIIQEDLVEENEESGMNSKSPTKGKEDKKQDNQRNDEDVILEIDAAITGMEKSPVALIGCEEKEEKGNKIDNRNEELVKEKQISDSSLNKSDSINSPSDLDESKLKKNKSPSKKEINNKSRLSNSESMPSIDIEEIISEKKSVASNDLDETQIEETKNLDGRLNNSENEEQKKSRSSIQETSNHVKEIISNDLKNKSNRRSSIRIEKKKAAIDEDFKIEEKQKDKGNSILEDDEEKCSLDSNKDNESRVGENQSLPSNFSSGSSSKSSSDDQENEEMNAENKFPSKTKANNKRKSYRNEEKEENKIKYSQDEDKLSIDSNKDNKNLPSTDDEDEEIEMKKTESPIKSDRRSSVRIEENKTKSLQDAGKYSIDSKKVIKSLPATGDENEDLDVKKTESPTKEKSDKRRSSIRLEKKKTTLDVNDKCEEKEKRKSEIEEKFSIPEKSAPKSSESVHCRSLQSSLDDDVFESEETKSPLIDKPKTRSSIVNETKKISSFLNLSSGIEDDEENILGGMERVLRSSSSSLMSADNDDLEKKKAESPSKNQPDKRRSSMRNQSKKLIGAESEKEIIESSQNEENCCSAKNKIPQSVLKEYQKLIDSSSSLDEEMEEIKIKKSSNNDNEENEKSEEEIEEPSDKKENSDLSSSYEDSSNEEEANKSKIGLNKVDLSRIDMLLARCENDIIDHKEFIDDMAEEGEESTPSEGSNDIIDLGESINSESEASIDDESYSVDGSFVTDDDNIGELLSGDEYDLGQEKKPKVKWSRNIKLTSDDDEQVVEIIKKGVSKRKTTKNSRIITPPASSSDEEEILELLNSDDEDHEEEKIKLSPKSVEREVNRPLNERNREEKRENDSIHLTPSQNDQQSSNIAEKISEDDQVESDESSNRKDSSIIIHANIRLNQPNKIEDNENRVEEEKKSPSSARKRGSSSLEFSRIENDEREITEESAVLNNSKKQKRNSLTIHESVTIEDIKKEVLYDRISKAVDLFCSGKSNKSEVSLNVSLDYLDNESNREESPKMEDESKEQVSEVSKKQTKKKMKNKKKREGSEDVAEENKFIPVVKKEIVQQKVENVVLIGKKKNKKLSKIENKDLIEEQGLISVSKSKKKDDQKPQIDSIDINVTSKRESRRKKKMKNKKSISDENLSNTEQVIKPRRSISAENTASVTKQDFAINKNKKKMKKIQNKPSDSNVEEIEAGPSAKKRSSSSIEELEYIEDKKLKKSKSKQNEDSTKLKVKKRKVLKSAELDYVFMDEDIPKKKKKITNSPIKDQVLSILEDAVRDQNEKILTRSKTATENDDCWTVTSVNVIKPSNTNKKIKNKVGYNFKCSKSEFAKVDLNQFDPKDFRNRTLFDSKHVRRVNTRSLLSKMGGKF